MKTTQNTDGMSDGGLVGGPLFQPAEVPVTMEKQIGDHLVTMAPHYWPSHPRGRKFS